MLHCNFTNKASEFFTMEIKSKIDVKEYYVPPPLPLPTTVLGFSRFPDSRIFLFIFACQDFLYEAPPPQFQKRCLLYSLLLDKKC